ncbi:MAG: cytochrome P450 [Dehalococcoidia bacterium]|nr:MAG: cytochrome P450 [Dehalococcoidia bacterium]
MRYLQTVCTYSLHFCDRPRGDSMPTLQSHLQTYLRPIALRVLSLKERRKSGVVWNPLDSKYQQDPVPTYEALREGDPVHYSQILKGWVVSRYEDIDAVLRDHKRFSNAARLPEAAQVAADPNFAPSMLLVDQPDHTRLRSLVNHAFTPKAIDAIRPRIEAFTDELIEAVGDAKRFDLMQAIAIPLPVAVISDMIGIPQADRARFKTWSDAVARSLEPTMSPAELTEATHAREALRQYFGPLIEERRATPQDDLISALVRAEEEGDRLSHNEVISTLNLLLIAGNETTTNLIGNGMLALLRHPDALAHVAHHPEAIEAAVEEMLRFDSPVQVNGRTALQDLEIGGQHIARGQRVVVLQGAGNHDPHHYAAPDTFDVTRGGEHGDKSHLAFGRGIHHCLGAPLARMEAQIVFPRILAKWPHITLATEPRYRDNVVLRGLTALEVDV